jgi:SAM-dependent methyltransferase
MHDTALLSGEAFANLYCEKGQTVVDIGGQDVNGSLRSFFENRGIKYISVDMVEDKSVDVVVKSGERLPFDDNSVDCVVSSSVMEHDSVFWITFKEMCRITKLGGFIYASAPSDGPYHVYPVDCYRFYSDSAQALAFFSSMTYGSIPAYSTKVVENMHIRPSGFYDIKMSFTDWIAVWQRVEEPTIDIQTPKEIRENAGKLEVELKEKGLKIDKTFNFSSLFQ